VPLGQRPQALLTTLYRSTDRLCLVLTADEVNPVMEKLLAGGIEVTALHNHMLDEQPRLFFVHFWANDDAGKLAQGLKAALTHIAIAKG
jgi:hypothetical protein